MDAFELVRADAASLHEELVYEGINPSEPLGLVNAAAEKLGLELYWVDKDDPILKGAEALFDRQSGTICCADVGDIGVKAGRAAHEIGHARIHTSSSECRADDIDPTRSTEAAPIGLQRVEDYGARERRELQADVFAREFLLPRKSARIRHLAGQTARSIADVTSLPKNLVRQQLLDALLLPPYTPQPTIARNTKSNPSQDRAVAHRGTPYLLEAGPGTGKTSTLVRRVQSLLDENVDPAAILVLTFSNRAAGELSERLTTATPDAAPKIWIGTFHAFGLDLIRRYHDRLGLPPDPPLFDRSDVIEVLEVILPTLPLVHYRNLWDPAMELREIVNAISRAKDELANADGYQALALAMRTAAVDEKQIEAADKALEVASVYRLYEQALRSRAAVDFGDLIMRPTLLLEGDASAAAAVQLRHRHVLVDEYQDVNRASARLLRALAGDAKRLWVVGDARQSIYRFRGASSANMANFAKEYPNAKVEQLEVNYRSSEEIKAAFQAIAPHMSASQDMLPLKLDADRGPSGIKPQLRSFETLDSEIAGIAASVREIETTGINLRDQAILCRTNSRLNDIATGLEARDIPVLHLGSLFERDEIRDLLALLSLATDPFGAGLVRVASMARYDISLQDTYALTGLVRAEPGDVLGRLLILSQAQGISAAGGAGLQRLADDLNGISEGASPWEFLTTFLLDRTDTLAALAKREGVRERMRAVAIWQFMNFVRDQSMFGSGAPIQRLLNRVRNLVLLAEERDLRQIPPAALHMNAVRLMTVHGSKGLEFEAVHLPGLTVASFPSTNRGQRCPPPIGLVSGSENLAGDEITKRSHSEEEQCLFFVALSRAQRHLRLYNSRKMANGDKRSPSPYLDWLKPAHLTDVPTPATLPPSPDAPVLLPIIITWHPDWKLTHQRVASYKKCPRRFFYTHVLNLGGAKKTSPFNQTHDCLYEFIEWAAMERLKGEVDPAAAIKELDRIWSTKGPLDHAYAADYRKLADRIGEAVLASMEGRLFQAPEELPIRLAGGTVTVVPDAISKTSDGRVVLRRVRTGYKRKKEYEEDYIYGLYHLAAVAKYGSAYVFEALHLSDELLEAVPVFSAKVMGNRKQTGEMLVAGIAAGEFPPDPDPVTCPRCPHFFICPGAGRGPLIQN